MRRFVEATRLAVKTRNWYGALTSALTLPDICGWLADPEKGSKARYIAWFDQFLLPTYTVADGARSEELVFLSGSDCYALRCALLHEGSDNISRQSARDALTRFHFLAPPATGRIHLNRSNSTLQLQVDLFCEEMCAAVETWYAAVGGPHSAERLRMHELLTVHFVEDGLRF